MTLWSKLATLLGVRDDQVDDALSDERRARVQLDRRWFLAAGAALAAAAMLPGGSKAYSLPSPKSVDLVRFDAMLKELYPDDLIERAVYGGRAIITAIDHDRGTITVDSGANIHGADTETFERGQMIILSSDDSPKPFLRKKGDEYEYVQPMKLGRASGYIGKVTL